MCLDPFVYNTQALRDVWFLMWCYSQNTFKILGTSDTYEEIERPENIKLKKETNLGGNKGNDITKSHVLILF